MNTLTLSMRNRIAAALLGCAKLCGMVGMLLGFTSHRTAGGMLLAVAGITLAITVMVCYKTMRQTSEECHDL